MLLAKLFPLELIRQTLPETGAMGGLGLAIARRLVSAGGAKVVLVELDTKLLEQVAKELRNMATAALCDLRALKGTHARLEAAGVVGNADLHWYAGTQHPADGKAPALCPPSPRQLPTLPDMLHSG